MSVENRRKEYNRLVSEERWEQIDPQLIAEFGTPHRREPKKEEAPVIVPNPEEPEIEHKKVIRKKRR